MKLLPSLAVKYGILRTSVAWNQCRVLTSLVEDYLCSGILW